MPEMTYDQVAMFITRHHTPHSYPEIGFVFDRDHSTVIHACEKVGRKVAKEPAFASFIRAVIATIPKIGMRQTEGAAESATRGQVGLAA